MCVMAFSASAMDVIFDATIDFGTGSTTAGAFYIQKGCVKLEVTNGMANGVHYRFYKNQPVTISSDCGPIIRVVFECVAGGDAQYGPGCFTVNVGDYAYQGKIGTWTGQSDVIVFTPSLAQVRVTKIIVTIDDGALSLPTISPSSGTYYGPVEVSIRSFTSGAQIFYTIDGSTPTTSSTHYTAPFTVSENTTVKAIATHNGEVSEVATADYEIKTPVIVQNIWESLLLNDDTPVQFANPVYVLHQRNNYLYVRDETGYALFYGNCGQSYVNGDKIPAGFIGIMDTYNCEREMRVISGFRPADGNISIQPEEITVTQLGHELFGHYVSLHNVFFDRDGNTYWLTDQYGNRAIVSFSMGESPAIDLNKSYDIIAIVGSLMVGQDCIYPLLPINCSTIGPPPSLCNLLYSVDDGSSITIDDEVQVTYQSGSYLYFKQGTDCFGLMYGNVGQTYKKGDFIPSGWSAKKTTYNSEPELSAPFEGFLPATRNEPVEPEEITPLDVNHEHWAHYVVMRDVTVTKTTNSYIVITDSQGYACEGFLRFWHDIEEGHYDTLYGIVGSYGNINPRYELLVIDAGPQIDLHVNSLSELYDLPKGKVAFFDTPLAVIYQYEDFLYVQDCNGMNGLFYGHGVGSFLPGDSIIGKVSWTNSQGIVLLSNDGEWHALGHGPIIEPVFISQIKDVPLESHLYVLIDGCTIQDNLIADKTGEMRYYNWFNVPLPKPEKVFPPCYYTGEVTVADINFIIDLILSGTALMNWDGTYDVTGFTAAYPGLLALHPTQIKCPDGAVDYSPADANDDGEINIGDVNTVIKIILGEY